MKTILVWYLITVSAGRVVYSPPMPTLEECQRVEKVVSNVTNTRCVQITEVVK